MGIFDFVKNAGEAILDAVGIGTADKVDAKPIEDSLAENEINLEDLDIEIDGDTVILTGNALTQEELEKAILVAGNIKGVARVDSRLTASQAAPESKYYTVQSGDTLSKIAREFYGDANKYPQIFEANKPMLSHPDKIYPGQNLRIPPA